ncbi:MAG: hypothetical protein WD740_04845 [Anaerolineales bacterium]
MKHPSGIRQTMKLSFFIAAALVLSSCASPQPTVVIEPTRAPAATLTTSPPLVLLVAPPQSDPALAAAAAELAAAHAAQQQLRFEQRDLLDPVSIPADLAILLLLAPDPGAAALAAAAPQVQIFAIGFTPETLASNLVALPLGSGADGSAAFIAGYLAALTAQDWRAGMLYSATSAAWADDFVAGAEYFCGACIPVSPPIVDLPIAVQAADGQNWQAAADQLLAAQVGVVFLAPDLEASGAGQYLAGFGALIIGGGSPPADLSANWLASVSADPASALRKQLPLALAGQPFDSEGGLALAHVNPAYLSEARLADIQAVISDLLTGYLLLPSQAGP